MKKCSVAKSLIMILFALAILIPDHASALCSNCQGWVAGERGLAISPDGSKAWVSFSQDDVVVAVDLNSMTHLAGVNVAPAGVMLDSRTSRLNASGTRLFVANHGPGNVMVIDTGSNSIVGILNIDPTYGDCIHATADGRVLITSTSNNQAYLHIVDSNSLSVSTQILPGFANAWVVAVPQDSSLVFGVGLVGKHPNYNSRFFSFDLSSGRIVNQVDLPGDAQPGDTLCNRILTNASGDRAYFGWMKISEDRGYGNVTAFDLATFSVLSMTPMDYGIADMSLSPASGKIYVSGFWTGSSAPGTLHIIEYDPDAMAISNRYPVSNTGDQRGVVAHPTDPNIVFAVDEFGNRLYKLELSSGREVASVAFNDEGASPYYIESGDGMGYVLCFNSNQIYKIDLNSGQPAGSIPLPNGWPNAKGVTAGYYVGRLYLTGWGNIYKVDPSSGAVEETFSLGISSAFSPLAFFNGKMAALQINPDNTSQKLLLFDASNMSLLASTDLPPEIASNKLSVSPDGSKLYWNTGFMLGTANIMIHDAATLGELAKIHIGAHPHSGGSSSFSQTIFDESTRKAYMLGWQSIYVLDMDSNQLVQTLNAVDLQATFGRYIWYPGGLSAIAFSPDRSKLRFVSGDVHTMFTYDLSSSRWSTDVVNVGGYFITDACLSPDGRTMFTVNQHSGSVSVIDLEAPRLVRTIVFGG